MLPNRSHHSRSTISRRALLTSAAGAALAVAALPASAARHGTRYTLTPKVGRARLRGT